MKIFNKSEWKKVKLVDICEIITGNTPLKKEKESRKKQKVINVKEIRLTPSIDKHDIEVKAKHANNFLKAGDKVKVSVRFRGRELGHTDIGKVVLDKFKELTQEFGNVGKGSVMEGRNMTMFLSPKQD